MKWNWNYLPTDFSYFTTETCTLIYKWSYRNFSNLSYFDWVSKFFNNCIFCLHHYNNNSWFYSFYAYCTLFKSNKILYFSDLKVWKSAALTGSKDVGTYPTKHVGKTCVTTHIKNEVRKAPEQYGLGNNTREHHMFNWSSMPLITDKY